MDNCTDPRFEKLLFAYELGMLGEEDMADVELHLVECSKCRARADRLRSAVEILRYDSSVRMPVKDLAEASAGEEETGIDLKPESRWSKIKWRKYSPAFVAVAALLILFILKPWHLEFRTTKEAEAFENRLAIMSFENISGQEEFDWLGEAVTSLLTTDLSDSRYMYVVSRQRVYDILRRLGKEEVRKIDRSTASQVAKEAGAKWMILGDIITMKPGFSLSAQLVDISSGLVVSAREIYGQDNESIFSVVDRLSVQVREMLNLPSESEREIDRNIADVTTHSIEAYRLYLEGTSYIAKFYPYDAFEAFKRALEYDSTFAMAYYYLAGIVEGKEQERLAEKALEYSDHASQMEQLYIKSRLAAISGDRPAAISILKKLIDQYPDEKEAHFRLALHYKKVYDLESSRIHLQKAIEIDPLYKYAVNQLAYVYSSFHMLDKAIQTVDRYIRLSPDEPNPYDSKGEIYARNGMIDSAIIYFQKALEKEPYFRASHVGLIDMYIFEGELLKAQEQIPDLIRGFPEQLSFTGRYLQSIILIHQGKFDEAVGLLTKDVDVDQFWAKIFCRWYSQRVLLSQIYRELEEYDMAINEFEKFMETWHDEATPITIDLHGYYIQLLLDAGKNEHASRVAREMRSGPFGKDELLDKIINGIMAQTEGKNDAAISNFEKAADLSDNYYIRFMLGKAYFNAGRWSKVIDQFSDLLYIYYYQRRLWPTLDIKTHYYLGIAYEKSENKAEAIEHYREFLKLWGQADPELGSVSEVKSRLARLERQ